MSVDVYRNIYIEHAVAIQDKPSVVERQLKRIAERDGVRVRIGIEQEPGSSGVFTIDNIIRNVLQGYAVEGFRSTGDKTERARPLAAQVGAGNVYLVEGSWNEAFLRQADAFPNATHDDYIDAASGAFAMLTDTANAWDAEFDKSTKGRSTSVLRAILRAREEIYDNEKEHERARRTGARELLGAAPEF